MTFFKLVTTNSGILKRMEQCSFVSLVRSTLGGPFRMFWIVWTASLYCRWRILRSWEEKRKGVQKTTVNHTVADVWCIKVPQSNGCLSHTCMTRQTNSSVCTVCLFLGFFVFICSSCSHGWSHDTSQIVRVDVTLSESDFPTQLKQTEN